MEATPFHGCDKDHRAQSEPQQPPMLGAFVVQTGNPQSHQHVAHARQANGYAVGPQQWKIVAKNCGPGRHTRQ